MHIKIFRRVVGIRFVLVLFLVTLMLPFLYPALISAAQSVCNGDNVTGLGNTGGQELLWVDANHVCYNGTEYTKYASASAVDNKGTGDYTPPADEAWFYNPNSNFGQCAEQIEVGTKTMNWQDAEQANYFGGKYDGPGGSNAWNSENGCQEPIECFDLTPGTYGPTGALSDCWGTDALEHPVYFVEPYVMLHPGTATWTGVYQITLTVPGEGQVKFVYSGSSPPTGKVMTLSSPTGGTFGGSSVQIGDNSTSYMDATTALWKVTAPGASEGAGTVNNGAAPYSPATINLTGSLSSFALWTDSSDISYQNIIFNGNAAASVNSPTVTLNYPYSSTCSGSTGTITIGNSTGTPGNWESVDGSNAANATTYSSSSTAGSTNQNQCSKTTNQVTLLNSWPGSANTSTDGFGLPTTASWAVSSTTDANGNYTYGISFNTTPGLLNFNGGPPNGAGTYTYSATTVEPLTIPSTTTPTSCPTGTVSTIVVTFQNTGDFNSSSLAATLNAFNPNPGCQSFSWPITFTNTYCSDAPDTDSNCLPPNTAGGGANQGCPITDGDALTWVLCPVATLAEGAMGWLSGALETFLYMPTSTLNSFQATSDTFRDIGEALLVIAGLVMVISQAAGLEIFAAYTVRKALPRIIFAAIGMALAWTILQFVITFFNDIGYWTQSLILVAAKIPQAGNPSDAFTGVMQAIGGVSAGSVVSGVVLIGLAIAGGAVIISLLGTLLLAMFVAFLVLTIRQLVIILCVILAPLAIAASVLPGTNRLWTFWKNTFLTTMMMFPIIMATLGGGIALSYIAGQNANRNGMAWDFMAVAALIVPFILLPFTFKITGGLMGVISGAVSNNGLVKGGFGALGAYRKNELAYRHQQTMEGKNRLGSSRFGGLYRRTVTRGGLSFTRAGQDRYTAAMRQRFGATAGKAIEEGAGVVGDDVAIRLAAKHGMTRDTWIKDYMAARPGITAEEASAKLGDLESGLGGARIGSRAMETAAQIVMLKSLPNAYPYTPAGIQQTITDAGVAVNSGLVTTSDAVMAIRSNPDNQLQNADFVALQDAINASAADSRMQTGGVGVPTNVPTTTVDKLRESALDNLQPRSLGAAKPGLIAALGLGLKSRVDAAIATGDITKIDHEFGKIANLQEGLKDNPAGAEAFSALMGSAIPIAPLGVTTPLGVPTVTGGATTTIAAAIIAAQPRPTFQQVRSERH